MSKPSDDEPRKSTGIVQVERAARVAELEISDRDKARNDRIALVQAVFDGLGKLMPRFFAGVGLLALIALAGLAIVYGVPIAIKGLGVDVSTITTGTTVTTTDGATTVTSATSATTTGPAPEPDPDPPPVLDVIAPKREDDTP